MSFTTKEKARTVAEYIRNQSVTRKQRWICKQMRKELSARYTIIQWHTRFEESANISRDEGHKIRKCTINV